MQKSSRNKRLSAKALVVFITATNKRQALKIGKLVVKERLAACANVFPTIHSVYRWKGKMVVGEEEALVILKTTDNRYRALEKLVLQLHSYEVPEIIALPIKRGFKRYIGWVIGEVHT